MGSSLFMVLVRVVLNLGLTAHPMFAREGFCSGRFCGVSYTHLNAWEERMIDPFPFVSPIPIPNLPLATPFSPQAVKQPPPAPTAAEFPSVYSELTDSSSSWSMAGRRRPEPPRPSTGASLWSWELHRGEYSSPWRIVLAGVRVPEEAQQMKNVS